MQLHIGDNSASAANVTFSQWEAGVVQLGTFCMSGCQKGLIAFAKGRSREPVLSALISSVPFSFSILEQVLRCLDSPFLSFRVQRVENV